MLEISHNEFAQVFINRFTESQIYVIGLCQCTPTSLNLIKCQHVIVVDAEIRHNVDEQRFESNSPEAERGEESAIEAVRLIIQHCIERRTVTFLAVIGQAVQILL